MQKLAFLVGKWIGKAHFVRGPTEFVELVQTEEAQYKLDGLILTIEGVGKRASRGQPLLQPLDKTPLRSLLASIRPDGYKNGRNLNGPKTRHR